MPAERRKLACTKDPCGQSPHRIEEGTVLDSERERIFGERLAGYKGIPFTVVHAYAFEHADRQDLFQEIVSISAASSPSRWWVAGRWAVGRTVKRDTLPCNAGWRRC